MKNATRRHLTNFDSTTLLSNIENDESKYRSNNAKLTNSFSMKTVNQTQFPKKKERKEEKEGEKSGII